MSEVRRLAGSQAHFWHLGQLAGRPAIRVGGGGVGEESGWKGTGTTLLLTTLAGNLGFFNFAFLLVGDELQYCSGFCHTLMRISHGFTCVPHPEPPPFLNILK